MAALTWVGDQAERLGDTVRLRGERRSGRGPPTRRLEGPGTLRSGGPACSSGWGSKSWPGGAVRPCREEAAELDDLSLARHRLIGVAR